jgi:hypothetical protein
LSQSGPWRPAVVARLARTLGVMASSIADRLFLSTKTDFESPAQWDRAQRFFYEALSAAKERLPATVQEELQNCPPQRASLEQLERARHRLWNSIDDDQMGHTPDGAATRAALCAFHLPDDDGPADAIWYFCMFFERAGLDESALVNAFRNQWPSPNDA